MSATRTGLKSPLRKCRITSANQDFIHDLDHLRISELIKIQMVTISMQMLWAREMTSKTTQNDKATNIKNIKDFYDYDCLMQISSWRLQDLIWNLPRSN